MTSYGIKRNIFFVNAGAKFGATAGTSINWIIQEPPFCRLCDVKIREAPKMAKYCPVLLAPSGTRSHKKSFRTKGIIYDIGWWCVVNDDVTEIGHSHGCNKQAN